MPSFTFVSTANAFVLRGATPVFVDIRPDTLNIDETKIEAAITPRTRAIVPVHYAGVGCDMDSILEIARRHDLLVIEDAAHAILARYRDRPLGGLGHLAALSFHETKNLISGEGGALLINDPRFVERAEIVWEKGTNRSQFFRGEVDKYTWVDAGSSYLLGEIPAAFLWAQMEQADEITDRRRAIWDRYHAAFEPLEAAGAVRRPIVPADCTANGHLYYLLLPSLADRTAFIDRLLSRDIRIGLPLRAAPLGAVRQDRRPGLGRPVDHGRRQRPARPLATLAWPGGTPRPGHRRGDRRRELGRSDRGAAGSAGAGRFPPPDQADSPRSASQST